MHFETFIEGSFKKGRAKIITSKILYFHEVDPRLLEPITTQMQNSHDLTQNEIFPKFREKISELRQLPIFYFWKKYLKLYCTLMMIKLNYFLALFERFYQSSTNFQ